MPTLLYIKDKPKGPPLIERIPKPGKKTERTFFTFMAVIGFVTIISAVYPAIKWQVSTLPRLTAGAGDSPIPQGEVLSSSQTLGNVQLIKEPDGFSYFSTDYKPQEERPKEFYLSIPKLNIQRATVKVDSLRFDNNLALFPGSALPGDIGNAFITGHSVLPQFADPENYKAIFTKLPDLEIGDEIIVESDGQKLQFVVQYSKVVSPRDISVLYPISASGKNLTLMTCVPPGASSNRLVVITSLI